MNMDAIGRVYDRAILAVLLAILGRFARYMLRGRIYAPVKSCPIVPGGIDLSRAPKWLLGQQVILQRLAFFYDPKRQCHEYVERIIRCYGAPNHFMVPVNRAATIIYARWLRVAGPPSAELQRIMHEDSPEGRLNRTVTRMRDFKPGAVKAPAGFYDHASSRS